MLSKRLWAAREAIQQHPGSEVRNQLLEVWLVEAQQCRRLGDVSMLYSVLPWEQYGHLGAGVMLLYTSHLFTSREERDECRASVAVSEEELDDLVRLGSRMLGSEQLAKIPRKTSELLACIVSSSYFNAEQPGGLVLERVRGMLSEGSHPDLRDLCSKLEDIYTPEEGSSVFGYLSWEQVKPGALTSLGNRGMGRVNAKAIWKGTMDVGKKVQQLKACWPACLAEMNSSTFVKHLLTCRPGKSTMPHSHALLDCIEHTWLWMLSSGINVCSTVPNAPYSKLKECDDAELYRRLDNDVLPRGVEKTLRRMAIEAYLAGAPEPQVEADPMLLPAVNRVRSEYINRGFSEELFPPSSAAWVARDPQDLDQHAKMSFWLWGSDFCSLHLHHQLLRQGGVDDEEVELLEGDDAVQLFIDMASVNFDTRHGLATPERIKPCDIQSHKRAHDLRPRPGNPHKLRKLELEPGLCN